MSGSVLIRPAYHVEVGYEICCRQPGRPVAVRWRRSRREALLLASKLLTNPNPNPNPER